MSGGYLTYRLLAAHLGFTGKRGPEAARKWVARTGVRKVWRGRAWLVSREDVDRVLRGVAA